MILKPPFEQYVQDKEAFLDGFIDAGSEQELFAASYIHGHLSLVAANVFGLAEIDTNGDVNAKYIERFTAELTTSIDDAINDKELLGDDINDVKDMLKRMFLK